MNYLTPVPDMIPFEERADDWLDILRDQRAREFKEKQLKKQGKKRVGGKTIQEKIMDLMTPEQRKAAGF